MNKIIKNSTFFVDIDGTLIKYRKFNEIDTVKAEPIQDVINLINKSFDDGCHIVITTARPETYRNYTINELNDIGLKYDQLIMGLGRGTRILINDKDPNQPSIDRAVGINLNRNEGFNQINMDNIIGSYESD
jgi:hydroxymethylpyrimidine pyrophosphatase-like HAD family hydrolase